jgi:hypothetical protein
MKIILFAIVITIISSVSAMACSCLAPYDEQAKDAFEKADIIAEFNIINASKGWGSAGPIAQIEPIKIYKGENIPETINTNYNNNVTTCGNILKGQETLLLGLYDTRDIELRADNARGYGFRVMHSCYQGNIRYYIENLYEEEAKEKEL